MQYIWDKTPRTKRLILLKLLKFDKKWAKLNYQEISNLTKGKDLIVDLETINDIRLKREKR